jgi:hypothetical protein
MNSEAKNPFVAWRSRHPAGTLDAQTDVRIHQWVRVNHELLDLFDQFDYSIEPWLKGREKPEPHLVTFIAGYGYSRTVTGDWKQLPIDIPEAQVADWQENSGLISTIEQLHGYQAAVAGSVAEILHEKRDGVVRLVQDQLKKLYDELSILVVKPLDTFTPTQWPQEMVGEEETNVEVKELDRIFDIYERLWCFEQGIEELRMLMITEDNPRFHVPNRDFYDALMSIDSQELLKRLDRAEPKLREILKFWSTTIMKYSGKPYHRPFDANAPEVFWWRHYKPRPQQHRRQQGNPRRRP